MVRIQLMGPPEEVAAAAGAIRSSALEVAGQSGQKAARDRDGEVVVYLRVNAPAAAQGGAP